MNRIGVMSDWFHKGVLDGLGAAKAVGAGAVQLDVGPRGAVQDKWTPELREAVRHRLRQEDLAICAVCGDLGGHGFQLAEELDWRIEETRWRMELAKELGSGILTSHIGVVPEDRDHPRRAVMLGALKRIAEDAKKVGCRVAIETGPERPEVLKAFIEDIGSEWIGVNYDPANLAMVLDRVDPVKGVHTLKDHIFHTHVKDGRQIQYIGPEAVYGFFAEGGIGDMRMEDYILETPLGDGDVDFEGWVRALKDIGYQGFFTIEREVGTDPTQDIQKAVDFLKTRI